MMVKRSSYEYEHEVRLVHWLTGGFHDALEKAVWNDATMRYDDLIEDPRPITPGISLGCDVDVLIERVIVSPFAPPWYSSMIEKVREKLGYCFPVHRSNLLVSPPVLS